MSSLQSSSRSDEAADADQDLAMTDRELLVEFLSSRDVECPRCGYNLRTLQGDRCTECGLRMTLALRAAEPMLVAWITATVAAALGAGIGLLFAALSIAHGLPPPRHTWIIALSWCA